MYCGKCGRENVGDMQYCTYCGATVSGDATSLGLNDTLDGAKTISNDAIRPEKVLAGRYRIIKQLGSGGMGEVYLASDAEMNDMSVAIKVLPPVLARNKRSIEALKREAARQYLPVAQLQFRRRDQVPGDGVH